MDVERTGLFGESVGIIMASTHVRFFIMSNIIDLILVDELFGDDPRDICKNFIYPSTMSNGLNSDNDEIMGKNCLKMLHTVLHDP